MKKPILFIIAGSVGCTGAYAQMDYSRMYERYKNFEQNKTVTLYMTGSHLYGRYTNVNMVLMAANLPQINPSAQAVGCGGMIGQDRLLVGSDVVLFHNLFQDDQYVQTGGFGYYFAGYKFYVGEKTEAAILTGFGLGFINVYLRTASGPVSQEKTGAQGSYALYNIRPLGAGLFVYNYAASYSYHCSDRFSLGLIAGMDCMPGSAWNLKNNPSFSAITKLQEGTPKGYVSITVGFDFDR